MTGVLTLDDLAAASGVSRRAVRFYVQRGLLPPPLGAGRGSHYGPAHLDRLRRIQQLQSAGHTLDAIARILAGKPTAPPTSRPFFRPRPAFRAQLWTRLTLADGLELHFDPSRHHPDPQKLATAAALLREIFEPEHRPTEL